ncbi:MAG TPA: type II toxin-antitoxin system HicB family antitoxin [Thermomicrobiales bacterium]|nr:type II toxin-antitoxin system HicB family antitoxin [Thermomicrobiales bacterium]
MTAIMRYKGYTAEIAIDDEADILFGRVIDVKDVITFQGTTVPESRKAFHDSVDDYLEFCAELGEEPDRPFSGKLPFRTTPEHHHEIAIAARIAGKSINAWMEDTLARAAENTIEQLQRRSIAESDNNSDYDPHLEGGRWTRR